MRIGLPRKTLRHPHCSTKLLRRPNELGADGTGASVRHAVLSVGAERLTDMRSRQSRSVQFLAVEVPRSMASDLSFSSPSTCLSGLANQSGSCRSSNGRSAWLRSGALARELPSDLFAACCRSRSRGLQGSTQPVVACSLFVHALAFGALRNGFKPSVRLGTSAKNWSLSAIALSVAIDGRSTSTE